MNKSKPYIVEHGYIERVSAKPTTDVDCLDVKKDACEYYLDGEFETYTAALAAAKKAYSNECGEDAYSIVYMISKGEKWNDDAEEWEEWNDVDSFDFYAESLKEELKEKQAIIDRIIDKVIGIAWWNSEVALGLLKALRNRKAETDVSDILDRSYLEDEVIYYLETPAMVEKAMQLLDDAKKQAWLSDEEAFGKDE